MVGTRRPVDRRSKNQTMEEKLKVQRSLFSSKEDYFIFG
jgi:hypothetical protein